MSTHNAILETRQPRRRKPRRGVGASVHQGTLGLGPELATGLVYVCADGACVRLRAPLDPGEEAEVVLVEENGRRVREMTRVDWCADLGNGSHLGKFHFRHQLSYRDLADLTR
jgi:hypothetical protein